jgi:hypothetical protein
LHLSRLFLLMRWNPISVMQQEMIVVSYYKKQSPWPESASELYQPSDRHLSAKLVQTFADRGCHVVSVTDPYGQILSFLKSNSSFVLARLSGPCSRLTTSQKMW